MAATEEKKYLINVESNLDEYTKDVQESTKEVNKWKAAQEEALKEGDKNSKAYIEATAQLKVAQKEQRQATATLEKMTAAQKSNGTSYNDLYKQWAAAEAKLKALEGTIIKNADGTITLSEAYKKAKVESEKAKAAVDQFNLGVNNGTTSVGQYSKGITDAMKQTGLFGGAFNVIGDVKGKFAGAVDGVKKFSSSFSTVKAAIASTGIGLLIIAIASLVTWFTKSAEGSKILKQAMAAVGEVFNTLVGTLAKIGGLLKDVFTGDWGKLKNDVKGIGDEWANISKNIKTAIDLANLELKIGKEKRKNIIDEAELTRDIAKLRLEAADKTKSMSERSAALRQSLELEKKLAKEKIDLADLEYKKAYETIKLRESHGVKASKEEKDAFANAIAARANAEQSEYERSKRATSQLTEFYKQEQQRIFNDKKARLQAEEILAEGNYAKMKKNLIDNYNLDITQAELSKNQKFLLRVTLNKAIADLDKKQNEEQKKNDEEYIKFTEQLNVDVLASDKKFGEDLTNQRAQDSAARIETRRIEAQGDLQILSDILDDEYNALKQSDEYKNASRDQQALMDAQYAAQSMDIHQQIADYQIMLEEKVRQARMQTFEATADLLGNMSELVNKNTLVGKSLAVAQATINTYVAASNALASAPNPIIGAIQMAAAIAMGLVQVKNILAVKVSKNAGSSSASSGGSSSGTTISSSFTAANPMMASSAAQQANAGAINTVQQNVNTQQQNANIVNAIDTKPAVISIESFKAQEAKYNSVVNSANV